MKKRIVAAAAILALSTTLVFAGPGGGHGRHGRHGKGGFAMRFQQELNLTADQKRLIAGIQKNTRLQAKDLFEKSRATMKEAREARKANDTARLDSLEPALEAHRAGMKQLREAEQRQIMSVLTAEQRAKYEELKAEHKGRRQNRKHRN